MNRINRRRIVTSGLALAASPLVARVAAAETYPSRPLRFIVPLAAGGGLDYVARIVGDFVSRGLGQQIFIENKTGAGGTIGIDTAIHAAPDGYSLLLTNDNVASAPHVMRLNLDYLKELLPISLLGRQPRQDGHRGRDAHDRRAHKRLPSRSLASRFARSVSSRVRNTCSGRPLATISLYSSEVPSSCS